MPLDARPMTASPAWMCWPSMMRSRSTTPAAEAGHVEVAGLVEVGQDRRLAADERALGLDAAVGDALHELLGQRRVVLRHRDVVEEHERFAAGADEVVHRHGDEVDADGVVLLHQARRS